MIPDNDDLPISFEKLAKLTGDQPENVCFTCGVRSGGIDMNRHLNNATYPELIQDALHGFGATPSDIKTIELNYLHACQVGEEISVSAQVAKECAIICGNNPEHAVFRAECHFNATQE
jgi:acyl-ACP thioesterase